MKRLDESFNLGKNKIEVDTNKLMLIITKKGKTKEIDLTLVEKLALEYEEILFRRKNFQDRRHIDYSIKILEGIKKLDREQLKYFITYLTGLTNRLSDLYQSAQDNPEEFCKRIKEYNNLFGKAKEINNN